MPRPEVAVRAYAKLLGWLVSASLRWPLAGFSAHGVSGPLWSGLHRQLFHLLGQALAGDVQAALDGADGGIEFPGHLVQRATLDVERHERLAVHAAELRQTLADLGGPLAGQHAGQRGLRLHRGRLQAYGLERNVAAPPDQPV